jgi:hypothetical protein
MLKSVITVINAGSQAEDVIGKGFHKYFPGDTTTTFSIDANLAAAAVARINASSPKLSASASAAAEDGIDPDLLEYIPYAELGAAGGVAQLDASGLVVDNTLHNFEGDGAPGVTDDETEGYSIRSLWLDATSDPREVYRCLDATEGAAVWVKTTLDLAELGTMAAQDSDNVAITGGEAILDRSALAVDNNGTKPSAVDNDGVAEEQSPGEAGDLTLDGADVTEGVATFDVPRKVTITSDTLNTGITLTVVGTDENGDAQTEADITGPGAGATVTTTGWFSTVIQVSVSGAGTNLKVGKGAGLVILDLDDGNWQKLTVGADCTIDFENWNVAGIVDELRVLVDNSGDHVIDWAVDLSPGGSGMPGTNPDVHIVKIISMDGGTTVIGMIEAQNLTA